MSAIYDHSYSGYQPAGYVGSARKKKSGPLKPKNTLPTEMRDMQANLEGLRREVERKDVRNASLAKELASIRNIATSQEREVKILRDMYDKLGQEKTSADRELNRRKEKEAKLEMQLSRMSDAHAILTNNQELRAEVEELRKIDAHRKQRLAVSEETQANLQREVEIMHRTFNLEKKYDGDGPSSGSRGGGVVKGVSNSREVMRNLYYELGKRQTEAHGTALSLAEATNNLKKALRKIEEKDEIIVQKDSEIESLRIHGDQLLKQSVSDADELVSLRDEIVSLRDANNKIQQQLEDASRRIAEGRIQAQDRETIQKSELSASKVANETASREIQSLRSQLDAMQLSLSHSESVQRISDRRNQEERQEIAALKEKVERDREALAQERETFVLAQGALGQDKEAVNLLQHRMALMKEELGHQERELKGQQQMLEQERQELSDAQHLTELLRQSEIATVKIRTEKDEALSTLERAMGMVRELSAKLAKQTSLAKEMEEKAERLQRSKEQVSAAVLDALHNERAKTAKLETELRQLGRQSVQLEKIKEMGVRRRSQHSLTLSSPSGGSVGTAAAAEALTTMHDTGDITMSDIGMGEDENASDNVDEWKVGRETAWVSERAHTDLNSHLQGIEAEMTEIQKAT
jgi:chromosome segregation ATPase